MCSETETVRIIGIGSPVEGDTVGLELVDMLQQQPIWRQNPAIEWLQLERPGAALLSYFVGADSICLVDALDGDVDRGVVELDVKALMLESGALSSHQFGVAETLRLAQSLNQLPPRLIIFGVGKGERATLLEELTQRMQETIFPKEEVKTPTPARCGR